MYSLNTLTRSLSVCLSLFLLTQSAFAYKSEHDFWKNRQSNQLASLPSHLNMNVGATRWVAQTHESLKEGVGAPGRGPASPLQSVIQSIPTQWGTIRKIDKSRSDKVILHIQDVHKNDDAQINIAKTIQALIDQKKVDVVALEGAFDAVDVSGFRDFENQKIIRETAAQFLKEHKISGPMYAALTSPQQIPLIEGVDSEKHYNANLEAYRNASRQSPQLKQKLMTQDSRLNALSHEVMSPVLRRFHQAVLSFRDEKILMGAYLKLLSQYDLDLPIEVHVFLEALKLEEGLNFAMVEAERAHLMSKLVDKMDQAQTQRLVALSVGFRTGSLRHSEFYEQLSALYDKHGIDLSRFKNMSDYLQYVLLSDSIDAEKLFPQIRSLEKAIYNKLIVSKEERELVQKSRELYLLKKLIDFSLTKVEWSEYKSGVGATRWVAQTRDSLGKENTAPGRGSASPLRSFERFYREAEIRDQKIAENLQNVIQDNDSKVIVLVTGGFHTKGIHSLLQNNDAATQHRSIAASIITFVPKISKVDTENGTSYLSSFSQEKTPLDKMFEGDTLFLSDKPLSNPIRVQLAAIGVGAISAFNSIPELTLAFNRMLGPIKNLVRSEIEKISNGIQILLHRPQFKPVRLRVEGTTVTQESARSSISSRFSFMAGKTGESQNVYGSDVPPLLSQATERMKQEIVSIPNMNPAFKNEILGSINRIMFGFESYPVSVLKVRHVIMISKIKSAVKKNDLDITDLERDRILAIFDLYGTIFESSLAVHDVLLKGISPLEEVDWKKVESAIDQKNHRYEFFYPTDSGESIGIELGQLVNVDSSSPFHLDRFAEEDRELVERILLGIEILKNLKIEQAWANQGGPAGRQGKLRFTLNYAVADHFLNLVQKPLGPSKAWNQLHHALGILAAFILGGTIYGLQFYFTHPYQYDPMTATLLGIFIPLIWGVALGYPLVLAAMTKDFGNPRAGIDIDLVRKIKQKLSHGSPFYFDVDVSHQMPRQILETTTFNDRNMATVHIAAWLVQHNDRVIFSILRGMLLPMVLSHIHRRLQRNSTLSIYLLKPFDLVINYLPFVVSIFPFISAFFGAPVMFTNVRYKAFPQNNKPKPYKTTDALVELLRDVGFEGTTHPSQRPLVGVTGDTLIGYKKNSEGVRDALLNSGEFDYFMGSAHEAGVGDILYGLSKAIGPKKNQFAVGFVTYNAGSLPAMSRLGKNVTDDLPALLISGAPPIRQQSRFLRWFGRFIPSYWVWFHMMTGADSKYPDFNSDVRIATESGFEVVEVGRPGFKFWRTPADQIREAIELATVKRRVVLLKIPIDVAHMETERSPDPIIKPKKLRIWHKLFLNLLAETYADYLKITPDAVIFAGIKVNRSPRIFEKLIRISDLTQTPIVTGWSTSYHKERQHKNVAGTYTGASTPIRAVRELVEDANYVLRIGERKIKFQPGTGAGTLKFGVQKNWGEWLRQFLYGRFDGWASMRNGQDIEYLLDRMLKELGPKSESLTETIKTFKRKTLEDYPVLESQKLGEDVDDLSDKPISRRELPKILDAVHDHLGNHVTVVDPQTFIFGAPEMETLYAGNLDMAEIGTAVGEGIGIKRSDPSKNVTVVIGDGGWTAEGWTLLQDAVKENLRIVFVILDDGVFRLGGSPGTLADDENQKRALELRNQDMKFEDVAKAMGAHARRVERFGQLFWAISAGHHEHSDFPSVVVATVPPPSEDEDPVALQKFFVQVNKTLSGYFARGPTTAVRLANWTRRQLSRLNRKHLALFLSIGGDVLEVPNAAATVQSTESDPDEEPRQKVYWPQLEIPAPETNKLKKEKKGRTDTWRKYSPYRKKGFALPIMLFAMLSTSVVVMGLIQRPELLAVVGILLIIIGWMFFAVGYIPKEIDKTTISLMILAVILFIMGIISLYVAYNLTPPNWAAMITSTAIIGFVANANNDSRWNFIEWIKNTSLKKAIQYLSFALVLVANFMVFDNNRSMSPETWVYYFGIISILAGFAGLSLTLMLASTINMGGESNDDPPHDKDPSSRGPPPDFEAMSHSEILDWILDHHHDLPTSPSKKYKEVRNLVIAVDAALSRLNREVSRHLREDINFGVRDVLKNLGAQGRFMGTTYLHPHYSHRKRMSANVVAANRAIINQLTHGKFKHARRALIKIFNEHLEEWDPARHLPKSSTRNYYLVAIEDLTVVSQSVYKLTYAVEGEAGDRVEVIVKRRWLAAARLQNDRLASRLHNRYFPRNIPGPVIVEGNDSALLISYVYPGVTLKEAMIDILEKRNMDLIQSLVGHLGMHAALGDIIGRSDRKMSNTIIDIQDDEIKQMVDIDFEFLLDEPINFQWIIEDAVDGTNEINALYGFADGDPELLRELLSKFVFSYRNTWLKIKSDESSNGYISDIILNSDIYDDQAVATSMQELLTQRLTETSDDVLRKTIEVFLRDYHIRMAYMKILRELVASGLEDPVLDELKRYLPPESDSVANKFYAFQMVLRDEFVDQYQENINPPARTRESDVFKKIRLLVLKVESMGAARLDALDSTINEINSEADLILSEIFKQTYFQYPLHPRSMKDPPANPREGFSVVEMLTGLATAAGITVALIPSLVQKVQATPSVAPGDVFRFPGVVWVGAGVVAFLVGMGALLRKKRHKSYHPKKLAKLYLNRLLKGSHSRELGQINANGQGLLEYPEKPMSNFSMVLKDQLKNKKSPVSNWEQAQDWTWDQSTQGLKPEKISTLIGKKSGILPAGIFSEKRAQEIRSYLVRTNSNRTLVIVNNKEDFRQYHEYLEGVPFVSLYVAGTTIIDENNELDLDAFADFVEFAINPLYRKSYVALLPPNTRFKETKNIVKKLRLLGLPWQQMVDWIFGTPMDLKHGLINVIETALIVLKNA